MQISVPTVALKPTGDVTRSPKQRYQWPHKKDLCPPNNMENNIVAPEVNFREYISSVIKSAHSGCETQRRRHQKSKTGVSVAPEKGLVSSKFLKKNCKPQWVTYQSSIIPLDHTP